MTRQSWSKLHRWFGLAIGLLLAVQGLTGALLVFHREFDQVGLALHDGASRPASELIGIAADKAGRPIDRLNAAGDNPRLVEARYTDAAGDPQMILVEAATGKILGERAREPATPFTGSVWRWIMNVHVSLTAGIVGELIIGALGLFLIGMAGSGLYLAWPKRRMWRAAFRVSAWKTEPQKNYGWHRATGLLAGIPLIVFGLTGIYMVYAHTIGSMTGVMPPYEALTGHSPADHGASAADHVGVEHAAHMQAAGAMIGPDEALAVARREFPGGRLVALTLPQNLPGQYVIRLRQSGDPRSWAGRATVIVDGATGDVLTRYDPQQASAAQWLDDRIYPLHTGEIGSLPGRLLSVLAGLALPLFFVTGSLMWLKRRSSRKKRAAAPSSATEAVRTRP